MYVSNFLSDFIKSFIKCQFIIFSPDATSASTATSATSFPPRRTFIYNKYHATLNTNRIVFILQHNNLTVSELVQVRQDLSLLPSAPILTVLRSGVFSALLRDSAYENLSPLIMGPTCIVATDHPDSETLTEVIGVLARHRKLMLLGGKVDGALLSTDDVSKVMKLPPMSMLRAEIVGLLEGPASQVIGVLGRRPQELVVALGQHEKNLREAGEKT